MQPSDSTDLTSAEAVVDINEEQLARTYAKAFLSATESSDQSALMEELQSLSRDVLNKFPDFRDNLVGDFLSHEEREKLIDGVLGGRASGPVLNLLKVLSTNDRHGSIPAVLRTIGKLHDEQHGRHEVRVYTPHPLDGELQNGLRQAIQSRLGVDSVFHFHIKPELLGGLVVQVGDTVFDGSVRTTLEKTRQKMVMQAIDAIESQPEKFVH